MMMTRHLLSIGLLCTLLGCNIGPTPAPTLPTPQPVWDAVGAEQQCVAIWQEELGRPIEDAARRACVEQLHQGLSPTTLRQVVHDSPEAVAHRQAIEDAKKVRVFPALTTDGPIFLAGGQPWRWMGVSAFGLANRFRNGENIDGFLADFTGYNVLRVWDYTPVADWKTTAWDSIPVETWLKFLAYVGSKGFRVELTLLTDQDPSRIEPAKQLVEALKAAKPTNLMLEAGNEPTTHKPPNGIDTAALRSTLENSGFPYTSGDYEDSDRFYGSYYVDHGQRDNEWPRRAHNVYDAYHSGIGQNDPEGKPPHDWRVPAVCDEPAKWQDVLTLTEDAKENDKRVTDTANDFRAYFGACALMGAGATFHFEDGKFGTRPTDLERSLASITLDAMTAFPADAPKGPYSRPMDSSLRTYIVGDHAVRIRPTVSTPPFNGIALDPGGILWRLVSSPIR